MRTPIMVIDIAPMVHPIRWLENEDEDSATPILQTLGRYADLAYRLVRLSRRRRWDEDAPAYDDLIVAWPALSRLGEPLPRHPRPGSGQRQEPLAA